MDCVFEKYLKFIENFIYSFYKVVLGDSYDKKLVRPLVTKYIEVRYCNSAIHSKESTFINKINKELRDVIKPLMEEEEKNIDKIKNIYALFTYVMYLDDCFEYQSVEELLKTLFADENIKIDFDYDKENDIRMNVKDFISKRKNFCKLFNQNEFVINEKRLKRDVYLLDIKHNCTFSKLYSNYAIDKAYNSDVVLENRIYLLLLLIQKQIIEESIKFNYSKNYIIDLPESLLNKSKKINKYLKAIDNEYLKSKIHFMFNYSNYLKYKDIINSIINDGYNVCLNVDASFDNNFEQLVLFSYLLVSEKYEYYDNVIDAKDDIKTTIITL